MHAPRLDDPGRYDEDDWVHQLSVDRQGEFRERGSCALAGGAASLPGGLSAWAELEVTGVTFSGDEVSGSYNGEGEYGTVLVHFSYKLP